MKTKESSRTKLCFKSLVDRPPFRPAQKRHRSRFISEPGPMPGNGPGSSGKGNGPGSCGATVPVVATNRDQCSGDQDVAHCKALVPVVGKNRDCCPSYIIPQPALCLKKIQDCVGVGWVLEFLSFNCT